MNAKKHISSPHVPIRQCVGCRARAPQSELLRIGLSRGQLTLDARRRLPGRGAYVHRQLACVDRATRRGGLARSLRMRVERAQANALQSQLTSLLDSAEPTARETSKPKDQ